MGGEFISEVDCRNWDGFCGQYQEKTSCSCVCVHGSFMLPNAPVDLKTYILYLRIYTLEPKKHSHNPMRYSYYFRRPEENLTQVR